MIAIEQARQHLETLGLSQAVEVLDSRLDDAARTTLPGGSSRTPRWSQTFWVWRLRPVGSAT